jgi:flagellar basal-body rod modification protein FlgD
MTTSAISNVTTTTPSVAQQTGSSSSSSSSTSADSALGSQNYFLTLLVAQMNNQDPLNPMDSAQVTSQMAAINTVSGIQTLSTQLTSLLSSVSAAQPVQDAALIGQQVLVPGTSLTLANGSASGAITLPSATTATTVTISDANGTPIKTIALGAQAAGTVPFTWDGTTNSGAVATAGNYTYAVTAASSSGSVTATTLSQGTISSVTPSSTSGGSPTVTVGHLGNFQLSQIEQIN